MENSRNDNTVQRQIECVIWGNMNRQIRSLYVGTLIDKTAVYINATNQKRICQQLSNQIWRKLRRSP
jgi:hypothetical protein